jgi:hypothetical protein
VTDLPRYWQPQSEADIQKAIDDGLLSETHYLDCKREIGATPGERKETARDLASFAIDGGSLLIGVDEDKVKRTFSLMPQPLAGLAERVENLAGSIIDPPLDVVPEEIESAQGQGLGYLLVRVRPSPFAPHMVDGVYYGRGEKKRLRLTDLQVRRYHAQFKSTEQQIHNLLDEEIARDPVPTEMRKRAHLYLVAHPLTAPRSAARNLIRNADTTTLQGIARAAESRMAGSDLPQCPPPVTDAVNLQRRARGSALCSRVAAGPGRTFNPQGLRPEERLLDIEFREDGSICGLMGNATFAYREDRDSAELYIFEWVIVAYAIRLAGWAATLGRAINYHGSWGLGLHISGIRGLSGFMAERSFADTPQFNEDSYREVTIATLADLEDRWPPVIGDLVGRLLYALGTPLDPIAKFVGA